jgi:hypothetical protein
MAVANKVQVKPAIQQSGAYGYLLWVRRDLPPVYSTLLKTYPQVANFESALKRQASGLGQDLLDTDDTDESGIVPIDFGTPSIDEPVVITTAFSDPVITVDAPEISPVAVSSDASGAAGAAASGISSSTLTSIASTVAAVLPAALKTAAVVSAGSASKTLSTAQLQAAAALAGSAPLTTGIVTTASGAQYLSALSSAAEGSDIADVLDFSLGGLPLWAWGLIGLGALAYAVQQVED